MTSTNDESLTKKAWVLGVRQGYDHTIEIMSDLLTRKMIENILHEKLMEYELVDLPCDHVESTDPDKRLNDLIEQIYIHKDIMMADKKATILAKKICDRRKVNALKWWHQYTNKMKKARGIFTMMNCLCLEKSDLQLILDEFYMVEMIDDSSSEDELDIDDFDEVEFEGVDYLVEGGEGEYPKVFTMTGSKIGKWDQKNGCIIWVKTQEGEKAKNYHNSQQ